MLKKQFNAGIYYDFKKRKLDDVEKFRFDENDRNYDKYRDFLIEELFKYITLWYDYDIN